MKDLKYVVAYIVPLIAILGLIKLGVYAHATAIFVFGIIPLIEPLSTNSQYNFDSSEKSSRLKNRLFDWLLYLNLPIVYGIITLFLYILNTHQLTTTELVGCILSVGIVLGSSGINVAHELGHRSNQQEQWIAQLLLLPSLYMHFFIEHNKGHHKNVATDLDPASAKKNEMVYFFWIRSTIGSYLNAWKLEAKRMKSLEKTIFSFENHMIQFTIVQFTYIVIIALLSNTWLNFGAIVAAGIIGFLLLETINYIEHYGLRRELLPSGRYERVQPRHSWNANYEIGRILLYELTRHSDHHYLASKKYQVLDHQEDAPQLPFGYPTAMLLALIPPVWFFVMNRKLIKHSTFSNN